jgi:hypothetical protein
MNLGMLLGLSEAQAKVCTICSCDASVPSSGKEALSCMQEAVSQRCRDVVRHAERRRAHRGTLTVLRVPAEPVSMEVDEDVLHHGGDLQ